MDIGIIANPASGKDIRRLTARASVFDNQEKSAIVRRCIAGIEGLCPDANIHYYPDTHHITQAALAQSGLRSHPIDGEFTATAYDSTLAAHHLRDADVVISLGGDGTNRAIGKTLGDVPLVALSTGTNNAFPVFCEATTAGMAAALLAMGELPLDEVAPRTKALHVTFENGETDFALIDVVGTHDVFHGTRAILDPSRFVFAVLSVADPSKVGMTAIGGMLQVVGDEHDFGLMLSFPLNDAVSSMHQVYAPVAPGMVRPVRLNEFVKLQLGQSHSFNGATMLAFDGERERVLKSDESITVCVQRDGPRRVDVKACMESAVNSNADSCVGFKQVTKYAH
ncbi:MAG: NAD(+)/NADH kinase [Gammaproteobacteria bacterium]|nr:NAD(+)/NADH kinase [Gammaproteobacteria bacterium]